MVEDTDDIRDVLTVLLQMDGADARAFATGREAVAAAADWDFDVLLTDLGLPDVPGEDLITAVLGMKARRPRVVVVTGFGETYAARARRAGADVVVTKPLDWSALRMHLIEADEALAA